MLGALKSRDYLWGMFSLRIARTTAPTRRMADNILAHALTWKVRSATWRAIAGRVFRKIFMSSAKARLRV